MSNIISHYTRWTQHWQLSLFEKVILVNCMMLIGEALAGLWVTSHNIEAHHYIIDTAFIVIATLLTLCIDILLLRASFQPLFSLLTTIRAVSKGETDARATITSVSEIGELARAFNTMLDQLESTRREQALLILQSQEEERRRVALELHDEAGQSLTALLVHTEIFNQTFQAIPETAIMRDTRKQLQEGLLYLTQLTQRTLENIRVLAQQLRPSVLDDMGLQAAFRGLVEDGQQRFQFSIDLHMDGMSGDTQAHHLPDIYETTLFRIAQESLTNIARHAHAKHVAITLTQKPCVICLRIHDDGKGYDVQQQQHGLGIFGMRERAMLLGGTLSISSQLGHGTLVEAQLPLPQDARKTIHA